MNVALFGFFILSFLTPFKKREWRAMGVTLGFFVALFTEMYGIPLTIYILTAILGSRYPALNPFSHASGHLWLTFLGGGALMMTVIHIISNGLTVIGFVIMWKGWKLIHDAKESLVTGGPYAYVRHPQYSGLFVIMIGMLIQWPTIITALMFPVLVFIYYRLSKREEEEMIRTFGDEYKQYRIRVPMFIPKIRDNRKGAMEPSPETDGMPLNWLAPVYDRLCSTFGLGLAFRETTLRHAALKPGERVLDVGCGTGVLTRLAAEVVGEKGQAVGIDPATNQTKPC